jgi:hypothetical protein
MSVAPEGNALASLMQLKGAKEAISPARYLDFSDENSRNVASCSLRRQDGAAVGQVGGRWGHGTKDTAPPAWIVVWPQLLEPGPFSFQQRTSFDYIGKSVRANKRHHALDLKWKSSPPEATKRKSPKRCRGFDHFQFTAGFNAGCFHITLATFGGIQLPSRMAFSDQ